MVHKYLIQRSHYHKLAIWTRLLYTLKQNKMSYIIINVCIRQFSSAQGGVNQCMTTKNWIKLYMLLSACPWPHVHTSSQSSSHLSVSSRGLIDLLGAQAQNERESTAVIPCRCDAAWQQTSLCLLAGKVDRTAWWRVKKSLRCPHRSSSEDQAFGLVHGPVPVSVTVWVRNWNK